MPAGRMTLELSRLNEIIDQISTLSKKTVGAWLSTLKIWTYNFYNIYSTCQLDKHPFKPWSCKHKQVLTDVLKPISTTSAPAKKNTAVPVNTSVVLPAPQWKIDLYAFLFSDQPSPTRHKDFPMASKLPAPCTLSMVTCPLSSVKKASPSREMPAELRTTCRHWVWRECNGGSVRNVFSNTS